MKPCPRVSPYDGYSGWLCFMTATWPLTSAGGKGTKQERGRNSPSDRRGMALLFHIKENILLGHGWHLVGNSLKWLTTSYPVILCDSSFNSTLNRCTFPIYIQNDSKFSFHRYGSCEQWGKRRRMFKGTTQISGPGCLSQHSSASICPLHLDEPLPYSPFISFEVLFFPPSAPENMNVLIT